MTAVQEQPTTTSRGGRPRNPDLSRRVVVAARAVLARDGLQGFTGDDIAAEAQAGKASIYRRWSSLDALLADVVACLGVRPVDHGHGPGDAAADLARVLHAATTGRDARAELAVLSALPRSRDLQCAYMAGPLKRLVTALSIAEVRSRHRGEPAWRSISGPLAGFRLLQHRILLDGQDASLAEAGEVVRDVVLPALGRKP